MPHYSLLEVSPTNEDWIPEYLVTATALVHAHGGKYLARTMNHERLEGDGEDSGLRVIIEWPSKAAAEAFMADPAYAPQLAARTAGSVSHHFLVEGTDAFA